MNDRMDKSFQVSGVTRYDVAQALIDYGMDKELAHSKALALTDSDMETLAEKMHYAFLATDVYWQAIQIWMEEKE